MNMYDYKTHLFPHFTEVQTEKIDECKQGTIYSNDQIEKMKTHARGLLDNIKFLHGSNCKLADEKTGTLFVSGIDFFHNAMTVKPADVFSFKALKELLEDEYMPGDGHGNIHMPYNWGWTE